VLTKFYPLFLLVDALLL